MRPAFRKVPARAASMSFRVRHGRSFRAASLLPAPTGRAHLPPGAYSAGSIRAGFRHVVLAVSAEPNPAFNRTLRQRRFVVHFVSSPGARPFNSALGGCNPHHSAAFTIAATQRVRLPSAAVATAARRHRGRQELAVVNAVARLVFVVTYMLAFAQVAVTHLSPPKSSVRHRTARANVRPSSS